MESTCLLCNIWARMPYAKRHTTPTTAHETEGAVIIGYWVASRNTTVPRICEQHMNILTHLDQQEERRLAALQAEQVPEHIKQQIAQLEERQKQLNAVQPVIPIITALIFLIPVQPSSTPVVLGPGPLTNGNVVTPPPPLPADADPAAIYRNPPGAPGTAEGALAAAMEPPVEGGKVSYPCPSCGDEIVTGDIHACPGAA